MSTHNLCFEQKYEEQKNFCLKIFIFLVIKCSVNLNRHVLVMSNSVSGENKKIFQYVVC